MATQYIKIDSSQRVKTTASSASSFTIRASNTIFQGRYLLKSIFIPITFFNINSTNNLIYFTDSAGPHIGMISPGFYTTTTYIAAISVAMTNVGSGTIYQALKDPVTLALSVQSSTSSFSFTWGTNTVNSAATTMGFAQQNTIFSFNVVSTGFINVAQTRSFNININNCASTSDLNGIGYSFVIPITGPMPSIMTYEPTVNFEQSFYIDTPTQSLNIAVYDDNHILLQCLSDWYLIVQSVLY